jgi:hypothetical protein
MHIEHVIARERRARQRKCVLEDAARQRLLTTYPRLCNAADALTWSTAVDDSLRRYGREATGRALLSLGRSARLRTRRGYNRA